MLRTRRIRDATRFVCCAIAAIAGAAAAASQEELTLYATTHDDDGGTELWWIDSSTLSAGLIGDTGHDGIGAIARTHVDGRLWGVGRLAGTDEEWIFELDLETGAAEPTSALADLDGEALGLSPRHRGKGFPGVLSRTGGEIWRIHRNGRVILTDVLPVLELAGGGAVTHRPGTRRVHWVFEYGGAHRVRRGKWVASMAFDYDADASGTDTFTATGAATCGGTMYLIVRDDLDDATSTLSVFEPDAGGDTALATFSEPFDGLAC